MNILIKYLYWQFIFSPKKILKIIGNYLAFGTEFFSIKESLKSLLAPWRRQAWSYGKGLDIGRYFEAFFSNIISRIIGFIMRIIMIIFFLLYEILFIAFGVMLFVIVLIYPFLAIAGIIYSLKLL